MTGLPTPKRLKPEPRVSSAMRAIALKQDPAPLLVGERVNSQGSRKMKRLLLADDYEGILEVAKSVEAGIRRSVGPIRFELTGYYTRFDGFIFRRLTGNTCDETMCVDPATGTLELRQAVYSQRDATFRGGEFQFQWDVHPMWRGFFGVDGQYDIVRATFSDGTNVPRIPPQRVGGGVYFRSAAWLARVSLLHAFAQNDIAPIGETPTPGYNLLKAEVSYKTRLDPSWFGAREMMVGLVGNNLLNENMRNSVSYTKDQVLMPGAGVRAFASVKY